ncbi:FAD-binding, type 2 [Cordyceps fumosorosea ARSEF 2679]|uniref:FAD-binding, type 2 n=1 Tax=Cordyceps fumosorosea (strain ARSEF 2679) TaxID=1081104 RepID=A0A167ZEJ7_CORFA|nr:FAD-binding, type 2 [Cordyceps fumosorosea ARSEF 2679]OAA67417.1 FAD-binding, type 2 [Cordyceps fumosorosea ARSEF 2679]
MRHLFVAATFCAVAAQAKPASVPGAECKCFPGDACWPTIQQWNELNATVDGNLIATVPLASACHDPNYNETACATLRNAWLSPTVQYVDLPPMIHRTLTRFTFSLSSSSSVMAPLFANQSCDPLQPRAAPCTLGTYVRYAVRVRHAAHVAAALRFAARHRVRLVIRNTGHDYLGRSTGAGALAVWTHHLDDVSVLDWRSASYTGKALRIGAGVVGHEALATAAAAGLVVVTGECPTVGLAGGYVQGGGHSALSTAHGLAADNALAYDVVVATDGRLVTATPDNRHRDLFWALSGGGGGNYGVVVAMVVRAHPDAVVSGVSFDVQLPGSGGGDDDRMMDVVEAYHAALPGIVDAGAMSIYFFGAGFLRSPATTFFNKTRAEAETALRPFLAAAAALNATVTPTFTQFPAYLEHYAHYFGPLPAGSIRVGESLFGGRLVDRPSLARFSPTARRLSRAGVTFIGVALDVSRHDGVRAAVLPQWRGAIVSASLTLPWSFDAPFADMRAAQDRITTEVQPLVDRATPGGGAYMNEADYQQPDFKEAFFGDNYDRLRAVKRAWDPEGLFYAVAGVDSDRWEVRGDGRLCKASA